MSSISAALSNVTLALCRRTAIVARKMGNEAILAPWQPVARMTGDLQNELPVPPFMEETAGRRPFHR